MPESLFEQRYVPGYRVAWPFSVSRSNITRFARMSGDFNDIHVDAQAAREHGFSDQVVHGVFLLAQVSRLVGEMLPDPHCVMASLSVDFHKPAHPDEPLEFSADIAEVHPAVKLVRLNYSVRKGAELLCRGRVEAAWRPGP